MKIALNVAQAPHSLEFYKHKLTNDALQRPLRDFHHVLYTTTSLFIFISYGDILYVVSVLFKIFLTSAPVNGNPVALNWGKSLELTTLEGWP